MSYWHFQAESCFALCKPGFEQSLVKGSRETGYGCLPYSVLLRRGERRMYDNGAVLPRKRATMACLIVKQRHGVHARKLMHCDDDIAAGVGKGVCPAGISAVDRADHRLTVRQRLIAPGFKYSFQIVLAVRHIIKYDGPTVSHASSPHPFRERRQAFQGSSMALLELAPNNFSCCGKASANLFKL
jgi:hypothetical protein